MSNFLWSEYAWVDSYASYYVYCTNLYSKLYRDQFQSSWDNDSVIASTAIYIHHKIHPLQTAQHNDSKTNAISAKKEYEQQEIRCLFYLQQLNTRFHLLSFRPDFLRSSAWSPTTHGSLSLPALSTPCSLCILRVHVGQKAPCYTAAGHWLYLEI